MKEYKVKIVTRTEIKDFIETHHYSKSINGLMSSYCFGLFNLDELIGAALFGKCAMANVWRKYVEKEEDLIELRRLCCIDDTPKNTESYFIGHMLRWLKKNTSIKKVISYADLEQGHGGIIYKASNFKLIGETKNQRVILWNDKKYHDKAIRTCYKGKLKPFASRLKVALETGEAYYKRVKPKRIYIYELLRT